MRFPFLRAAVAALALADIAGAAATARVDLKTTLADSFMGLGVEWDPYEYPPSEAEWELTLARLDFMKPAFLRVMLRANDYWSGFNAAGNPQYTWERLGPLFSILDYAQSHDIDVMLGEWQTPLGLASPQDPRWARIIADFVT